MKLLDIQHGALISSYEIILLFVIIVYILSIIFLRKNWNKIKYPHFWIAFILIIPILGPLIFLLFLGKIKDVNKCSPILILLIGIGVFMTACKEKKVDKYTYDYFNHDYEYLDADLKINISHDAFQQLLTKHQGNSDRIRSKNDSLTIIILEEFPENSQAIIAYNQLKFSYLRVSYYLWLKKEEVELLAAKYKFKYPYKLYDYIYNNPEKWDDNMKKLIDNLRSKVIYETKNDSIQEMDNKTFLKYALRENPQRKLDYHQLLLSGKIKCQSTNCCQKNKSDSITKCL